MRNGEMRKFRGKFFERQGISLVKFGDHLMIYKRGAVGPSDVVRGFFKKTKPKVISSHEAVQAMASDQPNRKILGITGIGFRLVIDKETGKILRKMFYTNERGEPVTPPRPYTWD